MGSSTKYKHKPCMGQRRLNNLLLDAVDETFRQVFKDEGAAVIFQYLENKCHFNCKMIAEKPEEFSAGLQMLLTSAAPVIEKLILKNLCSKLELKFVEKEDYRFSDYTKMLREREVLTNE